MSNAASSPTLWGHPRGLYTLFMTEFWERFSYYGMRALLILFLIAKVEEGGLGFTTQQAASIYGWYTSLVYLTGLAGGYLADRYLGLWRAVLIGAIVIAIGHFCLAFPSVPVFFLGLALIVCGTGLLKPNISSMVGSLYAPGDPKRDGGFSIFYMGINLGGLLAPLVCGTLGQRVGWHYGFAAAGVGMVLGILQFYWGRANVPASAAASRPRARVKTARAPFTAEEKKRILAVGVFFVFAAIFWGAFEQAGSSLNLFAEKLTRNEVAGFRFPSTWFQSLNPVFIVVLSPVFAWLWVALGRRDPSSPAKFAYALLFVGLGFLLIAGGAVFTADGATPVSPLWLVGVYFLHTVGELCLSPVGLSTVTKLAPARLAGSMMGVWFLASAAGNKLGGMAAGLFETLPLPVLFGAVAATAIAAAGLLAALLGPTKRLMGGVH